MFAGETCKCESNAAISSLQLKAAWNNSSKRAKKSLLIGQALILKINNINHFLAHLSITNVQSVLTSKPLCSITGESQKC